MLDMGELIAQSLEQAMIDSAAWLWTIVEPYVVAFIVGAIIWNVIKCIVKRCTFDFSRMCGDPVRVAKRKARRAGDAVDLLSAANDLHEMTKK